MKKTRIKHQQLHRPGMTCALLALSSPFLSLPNTRAFVVRNYPQQQHPKVSPFSTLKHHAKIQAVSDKNKDGFMSSDDNSDDNNRWISQERKKRQQKKQQQRQFRILDEEGENDETSKNNEECYYLDDDGNNNNMEDMRALVDEVAESLDLSRESFRMESFSSYTIVSILTATASFSTIQENLTEHDVVGNTLHACTLLFALVAALCGVYATVVFAMTNTYGNTALGMRRDDAYEVYMKRTGGLRFRAFNAFTYSIASFLFELVFVASERLEGNARFPVLGTGITIAVLMLRDWKQVIDEANVIFERPVERTTVATTTAVMSNGDNQKNLSSSLATEASNASNTLSSMPAPTRAGPALTPTEQRSTKDSSQ